MTDNLKLEITNLLGNINSSASTHPYIQDIIGYLKQMLQYFDGEKLIDNSQIQKLAIGLDRLITDDYEFYKSETGSMIAKTVNQILRKQSVNNKAVLIKQPYLIISLSTPLCVQGW